MWESIRDQLGKSAVLSYQSLARYRSLGFDNRSNRIDIASVAIRRGLRLLQGDHGGRRLGFIQLASVVQQFSQFY